jgi:hypothetical protein
MLWDRYVFRRGSGVHELWDRLFDERPVRLLYIAGRGFDVRAQSVMREMVSSLRGSGRKIESAQLVLVGFTDYELTEEIRQLTEENAAALQAIFEPLGPVKVIPIGSSTNGEDDISASIALGIGTRTALEEVTNHTDIVLDVSSLPRVAYLALLTSLLNKLVPNKIIPPGGAHPLAANGVNLQVLVAEDAQLDGNIRAEDPSNELVLIPGFSGAMHAESVRDWPLVWFPILGENRVSQLQKVMTLAEIPDSAEICPVLPHPSRNPRRADDLLVEYTAPLFGSRRTPTTNILHVHESNPFEAYRQLLKAMQRYKDSMKVLGGCRLVVTPLGSKLVTLGAGLACFEMRPADLNAKYGVAIPHAEPKRYMASISDLRGSRPEISALLLTGEAYA